MNSNLIHHENEVINPEALMNNLQVLTGETFKIERADWNNLTFTSENHRIEVSTTSKKYGFKVNRRGSMFLVDSGARRYTLDGALIAAGQAVSEDLVVTGQAGFRKAETGGTYCPECAMAGEVIGERAETGVCCNCGLDTDGEMIPGAAGYHCWIADDNEAAKAEAELSTFCAVEAAQNLEALMLAKDQIQRLIRERDDARRIGIEQNRKAVDAEKELKELRKLAGRCVVCGATDAPITWHDGLTCSSCSHARSEAWARIQG